MAILAETPTKGGVAKYHPFLVALHWFLAAFILAALGLGAVVMARMPNSDPMKLEALRSHMMGGSVILLLMLLRLFVRSRTAHPTAPTNGNRALDRLARLSHRALYALVFAQATSGALLALEAHLPAIVFAHRGTLPPDLWVFPLRWVHYLVSRTLMAAIALHLAGAAYHVLILRDGLLRRMWFGRRQS